MNLRVILFLLSVVVLILCVTGAKIKNNNMQKLIKCSVPLVLFVTLILCMSKTVEPYCPYPSSSGDKGYDVVQSIINVVGSSSVRTTEEKNKLRTKIRTVVGNRKIPNLDEGKVGFDPTVVPAGSDLDFLASVGDWVSGCGLSPAIQWSVNYPTPNDQASRLCASGGAEDLANTISVPQLSRSDLRKLNTYDGTTSSGDRTEGLSIGGESIDDSWVGAWAKEEGPLNYSMLSEALELQMDDNPLNTICDNCSREGLCDNFLGTNPTGDNGDLLDAYEQWSAETCGGNQDGTNVCMSGGECQATPGTCSDGICTYQPDSTRVGTVCTYQGNIGTCNAIGICEVRSCTNTNAAGPDINGDCIFTCGSDDTGSPYTCPAGQNPKSPDTQCLDPLNPGVSGACNDAICCDSGTPTCTNPNAAGQDINGNCIFTCGSDDTGSSYTCPIGQNPKSGNTECLDSAGLAIACDTPICCDSSTPTCTDVNAVGTDINGNCIYSCGSVESTNLPYSCPAGQTPKSGNTECLDSAGLAIACDTPICCDPATTGNMVVDQVLPAGPVGTPENNIKIELVAIRTSSRVYRIYYDITSARAGGEQHQSVYAVYGSYDDGPLKFPACIQVAPPFGKDVGGVSSAFFPINTEAEFDSWLTIGISDGDPRGELSTIGIDFDVWGEMGPFQFNDGAVFFMNPANGPTTKGVAKRGSGTTATNEPGILLAQLNVPNVYTTDAERNIMINLQGRKPPPAPTNDEWNQSFNFVLPM